MNAMDGVKQPSVLIFVTSFHTHTHTHTHTHQSEPPILKHAHTHKQVNDAIHALHGGECLRAVVTYAKP